MTGTFILNESNDLVIPGVPFDYLGTPVFDTQNKALLSEKEVLSRLINDQVMIPTTSAREGYFGDRHLEYWLSGYRDVEKVIKATSLEASDRPRVLDFGGASGRIIRHFAAWLPEAELFLCDINPRHVNLARKLFANRVESTRNFATPHLPYPDAFFDCIVAFSVFTHLDADDVGWLRELRRVTKSGGTIYATVHDEATWKILPNTFLAEQSFQNQDFRSYHDMHPDLTEKVVHYYSDAADYSCNAFVTASYLESFWFPHFANASIHPLMHDHQTAVVLSVLR